MPSKILTFILSFIIAVLMAEIGLQFLYRHNYLSALPYGLRDDHLNRNERLHLRPRFRKKSRSGIEYSTNKYGFRDDEVISGRGHILFLGDSTTFGLNIAHQETFPEKLEKKLGGSIQSINSATPAQGTLDELQILKNILSKPEFDIKIIILSFFLNDFKNNVQHLEILNAPPSKKSFKDRLVNNSRLLLYLRSVYGHLSSSKSDHPEKNSADETGWSFIGGNGIPAAELASEKNFKLTLDALKEIILICAQKKIPLIFVDLPPSDQFIFKRPEYSIALESFIRTHAPNVHYLNAAEIYSDYLEKLPQKNIPAQFYSSPGDLGHPGPLACTLIAENLEKEITRHKLLGASAN